MSLVASGPIGLERVELTVSVCASIQFVAGRVGDMASASRASIHLSVVAQLDCTSGEFARSAWRCRIHVRWRRVGLVSNAGRGLVSVRRIGLLLLK